MIPNSIKEAIVKNKEDDSLHKGSSLTATGAIGCPRALLISRMFPYEIKVEDTWQMDCGRRMHTSILEDMGRDNKWYNEVWNPEVCMFKGNILGLKREMSCKVDLISRAVVDNTEGEKEICDIKFTLSKADEWATEVAKLDHQVQLNLNKRLVELKLGRKLDDVKLSILTVGKMWVQSISPHLSDVELLNIPCGTTKFATKTWSYGVLLKYVNKAFDKWDELGENITIIEKENIIKDIPKVGLDMYVSRKGENKCTKCPVRKKCDEIGVGL